MMRSYYEYLIFTAIICLHADGKTQGVYELLFIFMTFVLFIILQAPREYCEAETFRAECASNEVVIISGAEYGRMKVGRCVVKDYGYVGCKADVTQHLDNSCSGRRDCEIRIPDTSLDLVNPCPKDFKTYLEAGYFCVSVHNPSCRSCSVNGTEIVAMSRDGYLGSIVTEESDCGSYNCPYILRAEPGQRFNISLLDFALSSRRRNSDSSMYFPEPCNHYATITEQIPDPKTKEMKHQDKRICGGVSRESFIYTSVSNVIKIALTVRDRSGQGHFLLHYRVLGCGDYPAPANTWVKRGDDVMTLGCVSTGEQWKITCRDREWVGHVGKCPIGPPSPASSIGASTIMSIPVGILIAVILAIAMVIGVCILTAGLIVIKRRRMANLAAQQELACDAYGKSQFYGEAQGNAHQLLSKQYSGVYKSQARYQFPSDMRGGSQSNFYNRTMEMRPLPEIPNGDQQQHKQQDMNGDVIHPEDVTGEFRPGEFPNVYAAPFNQYHGYNPGVKQYNLAPEESRTPHYFELDPELNPQDEDPLPERYVSSALHKSPEQENRENIGKEVSRQSSLHDVTSGLPEDFEPEYHESGNCSWP